MALSLVARPWPNMHQIALLESKTKIDNGRCTAQSWFMTAAVVAACWEWLEGSSCEIYLKNLKARMDCERSGLISYRTGHFQVRIVLTKFCLHPSGLIIELKVALQSFLYHFTVVEDASNEQKFYSSNPKIGAKFFSWNSKIGATRWYHFGQIVFRFCADSSFFLDYFWFNAIFTQQFPNPHFFLIRALHFAGSAQGLQWIEQNGQKCTRFPVTKLSALHCGSINCIDVIMYLSDRHSLPKHARGLSAECELPDSPNLSFLLDCLLTVIKIWVFPCDFKWRVSRSHSQACLFLVQVHWPHPWIHVTSNHMRASYQ